MQKEVVIYNKKLGLRKVKDEVTLGLVKKLAPDTIEVELPSDKQLEKWSMDGVAKAVDGCRVEPDGICPHGYPSWLLALGLI